MVKEVKRNYYLNLFSASAEKTINSVLDESGSTTGDKVITYKWNIRDLQLGTHAELGLVQIFHTNAPAGHANTAYSFRIAETYADGYDSFNQTSAIVYMGLGFTPPSIPTYHKLMSSHLNTITLVITDDNSGADKVFNGIDKNIVFGIILHVIDYVDEYNKF